MVIGSERRIDPEAISFILFILFVLSGAVFLATHDEAVFYLFIVLGIASIITTIELAVQQVERHVKEFRESIRRGIERRKRIAMLIAEIKQKLDELEALLEEAREEEKRC